MVSRLTVLIALLAQGLASMSPACLVRCIAPNGHECVELVGEDCRGCEQGLSKHDESPAACCSTHGDAIESDDVETLLTSCDGCGCAHSPLDFGPQSQAKSLTAEQLLEAQVNCLAVLPIASRHAVALDCGTDLRPQVSPHLAVLATVVLRV